MTEDDGVPPYRPDGDGRQDAYGPSRPRRGRPVPHEERPAPRKPRSQGASRPSRTPRPPAPTPDLPPPPHAPRVDGPSRPQRPSRPSAEPESSTTPAAEAPVPPPLAPPVPPAAAAPAGPTFTTRSTPSSSVPSTPRGGAVDPVPLPPLPDPPLPEPAPVEPPAPSPEPAPVALPAPTPTSAPPVPRPQASAAPLQLNPWVRMSPSAAAAAARPASTPRTAVHAGGGLPPVPPAPSAAPKREGRRLSPWRVLLGLVIVAAIVGAGFFAYRGYVFAESRPDPAEPWFAGYVDVTATNYPFESPAHPSGRDVVLAFIVAESEASCVPTWGTAYTLEAAGAQLDLDRRIARLREQKGEVVVSFGGAANSELATACADPEALLGAYRQVVERYTLSTIDLDIEKDDLLDRAAGERRAVALAALQAERRDAGDALSVWLTLPVGTSGLTDSGMLALRQMIAAGVDVAGVNAMTMDYNTDLGGMTMAAYSERALAGVQSQVARAFAEAQAGLTDAEAWSKVGATPMIGQNDVVSEVFTLDDAVALNLFAQAKGLGRMSMWSMNRDRTCGPNYGDQRTVSDACSGIDQKGRSFAETLAPGFGGQVAQAPVSATPTPRASIIDDPATSPYPVWDPIATYLAGSKVVWHGNVYVAKYWNRSATPDDPVASAGDTPWTIVGPVLPGDTPYAPPTIPDGVLSDWSGLTIYQAGDRVRFEGRAYQAKWWTQGDSPAAATVDPAGAPWVALTDVEVDQLVGG